MPCQVPGEIEPQIDESSNLCLCALSLWLRLLNMDGDQILGGTEQAKALDQIWGIQPLLQHTWQINQHPLL